MREGRLVAEFSHSEVSEERIVAAATGQTEIAEKRATTGTAGDGTP
jgi:ABC-type sugar transport system ATPase subunit